MATHLSSFEGPIAAFIQGASRGIGLGFVEYLLGDDAVGMVFATSRHPDQSEQLQRLKREYPQRLVTLALDVTEEASIKAAAEEVTQHTDALHLMLNVTGVLHDDARDMMPEKSLRDIDAAQLQHSFAVNAIGPIVMAKHFWRLFRHEDRSIWGNFSARVGSIGDNHIGGWYGYRASKAAQNQFTRTMSIEMKRRAPHAICVALHPGTVDTRLSQPFQGNVPDEQLFSVDKAVTHLLDVLNGLTEEDSGEFFDWAGNPIEW